MLSKFSEVIATASCNKKGNKFFILMDDHTQYRACFTLMQSDSSFHRFLFQKKVR